MDTQEYRATPSRRGDLDDEALGYADQVRAALIRAEIEEVDAISREFYSQGDPTLPAE